MSTCHEKTNFSIRPKSRDLQSVRKRLNFEMLVYGVCGKQEIRPHFKAIEVFSCVCEKALHNQRRLLLSAMSWKSIYQWNEFLFVINYLFPSAIKMNRLEIIDEFENFFKLFYCTIPHLNFIIMQSILKHVFDLLFDEVSVILSTTIRFSLIR